MKKLKYGILIFILIVVVGFVLVSRQQAYILTHDTKPNRRPLTFAPSDAGLEYEDVTVINDINQTLHGWYIPPKNGALIMLVPGYKGNRGDDRYMIEIFARHGYGVLSTSLRSNDINDGDLISFGLKEMPDIDAWYQFIKDKEEVKHIGMFGGSLGGFLAIKYASLNKNIEAVVTNYAFSSMEDTIDTSIRFFTGLPPVLFSPMIRFWAERQINGDIKDLDAKKWVGQISPRPILIHQGGADKIISPESGNLLYQAAKEPKELWFEKELDHCAVHPEEFEKRVIDFFDRYLLSKE